MTVIKPAGAAGRQAPASCCETAVRVSQEIVSREARTREVSTARLAPTNGDQWHADYELDVDLSLPEVDLARLSIRLDCDAAWYLTSDRRLSPLTGTVDPPFPVGRFVVVQSGDGLFKYSFPWGADFRLSKVSGGVEVAVTLLDWQRCGLTLWGRGKLVAPPAKQTLPIARDRLSALSDCLWLEPYPAGARAAICLTDHADFDTVEKLHLLTDLFVRTDFRLTKSVFPKSDPVGRKCEPGLDVAEYAAVVATLYEHGTEIAYHGFGPRAPAPPVEECVRRTQALRPFRPTTWIDHGTGSYLFSRRGFLPGGRELTTFLQSYGVRNYWSYADFWENPFRDLSSWQTRPDGDVFWDLVTGARLLRSARPSQLAMLLIQGLKNSYGPHRIGAIRRAPFAVGNWADALRHRTRLHALRAKPFVVYGLDGRDFALSHSGTWVFDTMLLNHLTVQLRPELVDRLCDDSGLLLGHSYLSCEHHYIAGNCITRSRGRLRVSQAFAQNLEHLAARQRAGDVISLSFAGLRAALTAFSRASLCRTESGWSARGGERGGVAVIAGDRTVISGSQLHGTATSALRNHLGLVELPPGGAVTIMISQGLSPLPNAS